MKKILVTGGLGFIGSHFVRQALERGDSVVNIDKQTYAAGKNFGFEDSPNYCLVKKDICDVRDFPNDIDYVVNFAAETHVDRSIDGPSDFLHTNVLGTGVLLSAAVDYWHSLPAAKKDKFRFLHISTDEVYGSLDLDANDSFTETTNYAPGSPYAATKASSDHLVRAWHNTYGLPIIITNCSNNYGPYQFPEKLIPLTIICSLDNKSIPVYGNGKNVRDWLYVTDHCQALFKVLEQGRIGETYNIGGETERANLEVVETVCEILNELRPQNVCRKNMINFVEDRLGHDLRYAMDISKIQSELGWKPATSFEVGIRETVVWYLENEAWWRDIQKDHYQQERLGLTKKV